MDRWPQSLGRARDVWERFKPQFVLTGPSLFLAGITVLWLALDRQPTQWDDSYYLTKSLLMFDALTEGGVMGFVIRLFSIMPYRQPLITALPAPIYLVLGRDPKFAFGVNLLLIPVLLGAVYGIGKRFWNRRVGLIASFVVGTMPLIYGLAHWYLVEFSLAVCVTLTLWFLIESEDFQRFRPTLGFGILCAAGLLLKVTFPVYVMFPALYVLVRFFAARRSNASSTGSSALSLLKTLSALAIPSLLVAAPWYLLNFKATLAFVQLAGFSPESDMYGTGSVFTVGAIKKYLLELAGLGASFYYVLLAVALGALILSTGRIREFVHTLGRSQLVFLSLWGLPFLLFLFGRNKNLRYIAPLLPILGLFIAVELDFAMRMRRREQGVLLSLVLVFPAVSVLQKSFFIFGDHSTRLNHFLCIGAPSDMARRYERLQWPQEDILKTLAQRTQFVQGKNKTVMLGTDRAYFNSDNFSLVAEKNRLPFEISSSAHETDLDESLRSLESATFFVYNDGGETESQFFNPNQEVLIREVRQDARYVELPDHWELPDGGRVRIFENFRPMWSIVSAGLIPAGIDPIPKGEVNFDNQIELTGLSVGRSQDFLVVKYRWHCLQPPRREYLCFTHILDESDKTVGYLDHPVIGGEPPMTTWKKDDVAVEELHFPLSSLPPHRNIRLLLGLYNVPTGERLIVRALMPAQIGDVQLADDGTAIVVRPDWGSESRVAQSR